MSKTHSPRIPISLSEQDRKHLQVLADMQGVSLAEAARRAVLDAFERTQEAEVRPRIEDPLRVELEQMKAKLAELESPIAQTKNSNDISAKKGVALSQSGPEVSGAMRTLLDDAERSGIADHLQVNGTVRTPAENKKVGGSPTSDHVTSDVNKKGAADVHFTKDGKNVDRQVYEHLAQNPSVLNGIGHGFQLIFHGHQDGKGLAEHIHLGWKSSRSDNEFTTEHSVHGEPGGYHMHSSYDSSGRVTVRVYDWGQ